MRILSFGTLFILILCLAVTTFIENSLGTDFVSEHIYGSYWFVGLWGLLCITALLWMINRKVYKQKAVFSLHLSFLVILTGAFLTFTTGVQGYIHLREGEQKNMFIEEESQGYRELPFTLSLDSFKVEYYPGTDAPANYISYLKVSNGESVLQKKVSMNNILSHQGFRFYQSSFDDDGKGTILSVNSDRLGIPVTYGGYLLLGFSMLWILLSPQGGFRRLLRHPLLKKGAFGLFIFFLPVQLAAHSPTLNKATSGKLGELQLMYNNRVTPLQTLARDFTLKLTGKDHYQAYTAEQVFAGWIFYPQEWQHEPMIRIKSKELQRLLACSEYAPFHVFFAEDKTYRLASFWSKLHQGGKQTPLIKAIAETDEKIQLITMLQQGTLLKLFPHQSEKGLQWFSPTEELPEKMPDDERNLIRNTFSLLYGSIQNENSGQVNEIIQKLKNYQQQQGSTFIPSRQKVKAELIYNRFDFTTLLYRINLTLGLVAFVYFCFCLLSGKKENRKISGMFTVFLLCSFLFHSCGILLRTYIGGRFPLSNGYETMIFIAWCVMLISLAFRRRFILMVSFGFLLSGFTLLVASLGQMNPQITPLMPVLVSPWLSIHVSLIMMSYALLGFIMLNGLTALILISTKKKVNEQIERLTLISRLFLYPATFFLGAGIFIGAIWANVSWGRYWAWDPKEVWALITFLFYGLAFHMQSLKLFNRPVFFHLFMVLAFGTVLMTYFGVNYVLGGMHSYAG